MCSLWHLPVHIRCYSRRLLSSSLNHAFLQRLSRISKMNIYIRRSHCPFYFLKITRRAVLTDKSLYCWSTVVFIFPLVWRTNLSAELIYTMNHESGTRHDIKLLRVWFVCTPWGFFSESNHYARFSCSLYAICPFILLNEKEIFSSSTITSVPSIVVATTDFTAKFFIFVIHFFYIIHPDTTLHFLRQRQF